MNGEKCYIGFMYPSNTQNSISKININSNSCHSHCLLLEYHNRFEPYISPLTFFNYNLEFILIYFKYLTTLCKFIESILKRTRIRELKCILFHF